MSRPCTGRVCYYRLQLRLTWLANAPRAPRGRAGPSARWEAATRGRQELAESSTGACLQPPDIDRF